MNIATTLSDPCPSCGRNGQLCLVRGHTTAIAGHRIPLAKTEHFRCSHCAVEFTTPACCDPLEALASFKAAQHLPPNAWARAKAPVRELATA